MRTRVLRFLIGVLALASSLCFYANDTWAHRGCCSWHGGVSACDSSAGKLVCNDGSYSPSCRCEIRKSAPRLELPTPMETEVVSLPSVAAEPVPIPSPFPSPTPAATSTDARSEDSPKSPGILAATFRSYGVGHFVMELNSNGHRFLCSSNCQSMAFLKAGKNLVVYNKASMVEFNPELGNGLCRVDGACARLK